MRAFVNLLFRYLSENLRELLGVCSFLDPRYKACYLAEPMLSVVKDRVHNECTQIFANALINTSNTDTPSATTQAASCSKSTPKCSLATLLKKRRLPDSDFDSMPRPLVISSEQKAQHELQSYLTSPVIDSEGDPLMWWCTKEKSLPSLSCLAKSYLAIQATSVTSERIFSYSGNIVTNKRACLKPDRVNMLSFLAFNL